MQCSTLVAEAVVLTNSAPYAHSTLPLRPLTSRVRVEVLNLTVILLSPQKSTQAECPILFVDEEDRGSMSRARLADEPVVEVLIDKGAEGVELSR